jgi:FKBP-type peptidyl-prolyl cis-trans isomerase FkpA
MKYRFSRFLVAASLVSVAFLPACGKTDNSVTGPTGPTTLQITDVTVGTGATAASGDTVTVNYIGAFLDGTVFDSSFSRGVPFTFQLGANQVIKGFDQGVVGMKVGGRRLLAIPSDLAYGAQGSASIPPNTPIQFQIDLVSIAGK